MGPDLVGLELRHRRFHDTRATFITLCLEAGAEPVLIERVTHTRKARSAFDGYVRTKQWESICREVAKLEVRLPSARSAKPLLQVSVV